jgi:6-phosphofructokinase 1
MHQDCCLIPESPFYLEGEGGLFRYIEKRLKDNGHMVIVVAEGAGQKLIAENMKAMGQDASGNALLLDVGLWLSQKINVRLLKINFVSSVCLHHCIYVLWLIAFDILHH